MMRCLSTDQKMVYQQYCKLSREVAEFSKRSQGEVSLYKNIWSIISKEGIFGLAISKQYGGANLSWQDCVVAVDGFFSNYSSTEFLALIISQISSIYLIHQHGTESIKKKYLPRLIQGEVAVLSVSENIREYSFCLNKIKQLPDVGNNKIFVYAEKTENSLVFYIDEKKFSLNPLEKNKKNDLALDVENIFLSREAGLSSLCDLINFERLVYGVLSARFLEK